MPEKFNSVIKFREKMLDTKCTSFIKSLSSYFCVAMYHVGWSSVEDQVIPWEVHT